MITAETPISTPSTVSAERQLVGARALGRDAQRVSNTSHADAP